MNHHALKKMQAVIPMLALVAFSMLAFAPKAHAGDDWKTDLAKAQAEAKDGDKALLVLFTGSDW